MKKKYELTNQTVIKGGKLLHRIKALINIPGTNVKTGDLGGFIEGEHNLSQDSSCWIYGEARVSGNALICDNATVHDNAQVRGEARVSGNALICDEALVCDTVLITGDTCIFDKAKDGKL